MADVKRGRPKGSQTVMGEKLRRLVYGALKDAGGRKYLAAQAVENPGAFMSLLGKLLPKDVTVSGEVKYTLEDLILGVPADKKEADGRPAPTSH